MKRLRIWHIAIPVVAMVTTIWILQRSNRPTTSVAVPSPTAAPSPVSGSANSASAKSDKAALPATPAGAPSNLGARDNYVAAVEILAQAKSGDPAAQYELYRLLRECDDGYRLYFDRGNHRRTLDEALQWASTRPSVSVDEVNQTYERCHRLKETESDSAQLGNSGEWLRKAAEAGNHFAQIDLATKISVEAGVSGTVENAAKRDEAKKFALDALASKDPAVMWQVGDLAMLISGDQKKADHDQWVWRVAACQRGYDCGTNADWLKFQCRFDTNCQPYDTGLDYIRRHTDSEFDQIEQEAKDLNAKLDANDFSGLGG